MTPADLGSLTKAISDLSLSVDLLSRKYDADQKRWSQRTWVGAITLAALVFVAVWVVAGTLRLQDVVDEQQADRVQQDYQRCLSTNESRAAIVKIQRAYTDRLVTANPRERTPAEQAAFDEIVTTFKAGQEEDLAPLGPRNCEAILDGGFPEVQPLDTTTTIGAFP